MASEPSGTSASSIGAGGSSEVRDTSLRTPAHSGFAEPNALFRTATDLPLELRALRGHVNPSVLRYAVSRAEEVGITADIALRHTRVLSPDRLLEIYSADLGLAVERLQDTTQSPVDILQVLGNGQLPASVLARDDASTIIALSGENIRDLYQRCSDNPAAAKEIRITSAERLRMFLERSQERWLTRAATFGLADAHPAFSAATTSALHLRKKIVCALLLLALLIYWMPQPALLIIELALAAVFLSWSALRIFSCLTAEKQEAARDVNDRDLPVYTILIPLHDEARVVPDLIKAISALNYPREKLDIKLILEPEDFSTIAAVNAIRLDPCFEIVLAPASSPQTKPKALRAALPFARGEFLVVYDAEDRPHPDQLRDAYRRFLDRSDRLACVQAKLAVDNAESTFLTEHFRYEYAGLFDVLLPALARLGLPVPLGGTSNHFRVKTLREVGGWDPHNVTEDADLGIRLARFGYTTDVVNSTTFEEAPAHLDAWLPQRTRWMKGWLQTYFVHMRDPALLLRQLQWRGFLAFHLLIGGSVLAALVHPIYAVWLLADSAFGSLFLPAGTLGHGIQKSLPIAILVSGYFASGMLAFIGMRRRKRTPSLWILLTIPAYWLLLSAAAWRAVWKLITAPYQWEKTAHGMVRRS